MKIIRSSRSAKPREAVLDLHQWKWQGNECAAPWALEDAHQCRRACPHTVPDPPLLSAVLHWSVLVWDCCSALVCSLTPGTARWLSSLQRNTGSIHSAQRRQSKRAEAGQTQYSSVPATWPCAVSVMWHWGLPGSAVSHSSSGAKTTLTTGVCAAGRWIPRSWWHRFSTPRPTPSLPVGLSLAQGLPLFVWGGKGAEHNLNHRRESLEPTWRHLVSASSEQNAARRTAEPSGSQLSATPHQNWASALRCSTNVIIL